MSRLLIPLLLLGLAPQAYAQRGKKPLSKAQRAIAKVLPSVVKVYGAGGFTGVPSYGTGVIVHERGFILTAWSIALKTPELKIVTHDGKRYPAQIWRADPGRGVALLRAKKAMIARFKALRLGDSSALRRGDPVLGIGNAFGIIYGNERPGVMRGVVSAIASIRRGGARVVRLPPRLTTVILTDVANNPGTQGGPLVTLEGELVGILGRLIESRTTNTILNFAVPADSVRAFVKAGLAADAPQKVPPTSGKRRVRRRPVDLGIHLQRAHLVRSPLAYVERVAPKSVAAKAGLKADDLIFRLGQRTIRSCRDWDQALARTKPGQELKLLVKRKERMLSLSLTIPRKGSR